MRASAVAAVSAIGLSGVLSSRLSRSRAPAAAGPILPRAMAAAELGFSSSSSRSRSGTAVAAAEPIAPSAKARAARVPSWSAVAVRLLILSLISG
jgi:hypothetical protein